MQFVQSILNNAQVDKRQAEKKVGPDLSQSSHSTVCKNLKFDQPMVAYGPVFPSMIGFLEFCVFYFCQGVETTESVYERRKHSKQDLLAET